MAEMLVVASKVKGLVKKKGLRTSKEFLEELSKRVANLVTSSIEKAKEDNRGTVKDRDLPE